ncbi:hypothetical protein LCGC14_2327880 [marine sediment metagenome]|uniref:Uncharacterized protein n=2 Tax=marine sediment metagenome TaxID=412755 RepID=A0A0F9CGG6_9ZZZZ
MAATSASIKLTVTGEELVTGLTNTQSVNVAEKLEQNITLTSSSQTIDISFLDTIKTFIFEASSNYIVEITADSEVIEFGCNGVFMLQPTAAFVATIDSIVVKNESSTALTIKVRIYSE